MCVVVVCSQVEQKKQHASVTEARHSTLESQLQTEREALERKEKEVPCCSRFACMMFLVFLCDKDQLGMKCCLLWFGVSVQRLYQCLSMCLSPARENSDNPDSKKVGVLCKTQIKTKCIHM